jgi:PST family polysaccharide transporter
VIFYGSSEKPEHLYQAMDVFVLPSLFEGLPLVAVEAQCAGLPAICSSAVTEEAKLTELFIHANGTADDWADVILKQKDGIKQRRSHHEAVALARLLAPDQFGVITTVTMISSLALMLTDIGFSSYIFQHVFKDKDELKKTADCAFTYNLILTVAIYLLLVIFASPLADLTGSPGLGPVVTVSGLSVLFGAFQSVQSAVIRRDIDFKTPFIARLISTLLQPAVAIPLAILLKNYWALTISYQVVSFMSAVVLFTRCKWKPKLNFSFKWLKPMLSFSAWSFLDKIIVWASNNADIFIIGLYLTDYYLGLYNRGINTGLQILSIFAAPMIALYSTAVARLNTSLDDMFSAVLKFQRLASFILIPMSVGIFIYPEFITRIFLSWEWLEAAPLLAVYALYGTLSSLLYHPANSAIYSRGHLATEALISGVMLVGTVITLLIFAPMGFLPMCYAITAVRAVTCLLPMIIARVKFRFSLLKQFRQMIPALISTAVMAILAYALRSAGTGDAWDFASIGICAAVYFGVLALFPAFRYEIREFMKSRKRKQEE